MPPSHRSGRHDRGRRARGFTLVEMLVAFTILAVALVALMQAFGSGFRGLHSSERYALAVLLARSTLERVGTELPLEPGEWDGESDQRFRWIARVRPYEPAAEAEALTQRVVPYEVEVTVSWDDDRSVSLKTLRLAPRR